MAFTEEDKLKALAIVHIFETSRPLGDYAACAVLNDGAGVSYGIDQFTHRSGSLLVVVNEYLKSGASVGREVLTSRLASLRSRTDLSIRRLSGDVEFKNALRAAAATPEMKAVQRQEAFELYLRPAIGICDARGFSRPLSLAVVYDSLVHGSWDRIAAGVGASKDEKTWITAYVRKRHLWLTNVPRLRVTNVRTKFFLDQIAVGNWELRLPVTVHGYRLTTVEGEMTGRSDTAIKENGRTPSSPYSHPSFPEEGSLWETAGSTITSAGEKFDAVEGAVDGFVARKDAVKSLWTTVGGTLWQAAWAVFGFFVGLPKEVWIVVAILAGLLMLAYLYRQIELGKIRERVLKNA